MLMHTVFRQGVFLWIFNEVFKADRRFYKHCERRITTEMYYPNCTEIKHDNKGELTLGLLNLMPNKRQTFLQWQRAFEKSGLRVKWLEFGLESHQPKSEESQKYQKESLRLNQVTWPQLDALIVTGAPVEKLAFESVSYWSELKAVLSETKKKKCPILSVCWGAQAALYVYYDIDKVLYQEKVTGVFPHKGVNYFSPFMSVELPHSRYSGWENTLLEEHQALTPLLVRDNGEIVAFYDEVNNFYFSGHPEYDVETLALEYSRDMAKGIWNTKPFGYRLKGQSLVFNGCHWGEDFGKMLYEWYLIIKNEEI